MCELALDFSRCTVCVPTPCGATASERRFEKGLPRSSQLPGACTIPPAKGRPGCGCARARMTLAAGWRARVTNTGGLLGRGTRERTPGRVRCGKAPAQSWSGAGGEPTIRGAPTAPLPGSSVRSVEGGGAAGTSNPGSALSRHSASRSPPSGLQVPEQGHRPASGNSRAMPPKSKGSPRVAAACVQTPTGSNTSQMPLWCGLRRWKPGAFSVRTVAEPAARGCDAARPGRARRALGSQRPWPR